jgi:hypothetical protein
MRRRGTFDILAANFQLRSMDRGRDVETRDGHGFAGQSRNHGAGDDAHLLVAGIDEVAHVRGSLAIYQQAEDLEALLALQTGMGVRAVEVVLSRADGEIEPEFPETVAGRIFIEGIHLGHVVGIEQQRAFDSEVIQSRETSGDDAEGLALAQDGVPDQTGVLALAEDFVAAFAGVAGARNRDSAAEQGRRHMMEVLQVANPRDMLGEKIDGHRSLQRQVMQIIVDDHGRVASDHVLRQGLMAGAAAVHHHPGIGSHAIEDAVFDEMAGLVQHAGIGRFPRIDLGHIARRRIVQHGGGMRPDQVQLL